MAKQKWSIGSLVAVIGLSCGFLGWAIAYGNEKGEQRKTIQQHEQRIGKIETNISQLTVTMTQTARDVSWIRENMEKNR